MTLPKSIELRWQSTIIESWLNTLSISSGAREELLAVQRAIKEEMDTLEESRTCFAHPEPSSRRVSGYQRLADSQVVRAHHR